MSKDRWLCGAGVFACLLLAGCGAKKEAETEAAVPVQVAPVTRATVQRIITANGVLYPRDQSNIMPKISAPVKKFFVNRGDRVRAGELLAQLEDRDLTAAAADSKGQLDQAEANYRTVTAATLPDETTKSQQDVDAAKEALDAAQKVYESRQQLFREGAIARKLVDDAAVSLAQARSQYETALKHLQTFRGPGSAEQAKAAQAQVDSARGRYQAAQAQVGYSEIRSPIDGVIADRPLYAGEMANAGSPLLNVVDISSVIARMNVPSTDANMLRKGSPATIHAPNGDIAGRISVVSPAVDPQSTTVEIWVEAPNPKGLLKPGAAVQASMLAQTIPDALVVPNAALLSAQDGSTEVLVVTADNVAHERRVKTGVKDGDNVQIVSGVNEGDSVVTEGGVGVQDGTKVKVQKPGAEDKGEAGGK